MNVWRQRHVADLLEDGTEVFNRRETKSAFAEVGGSEDLCFEERRCVIGCSEVEAFAGLDLSTGTHECGPLVPAELLGEEDLDTAGRVRRVGLSVWPAGAGSVEARGDDAAVVEDEEVARVQEVRKVAEEVVAILTGMAVEDKHAAGAADGRRRLRDELFGEIEMEVGYAHGLSDSSVRGF